VVPIIIIIIIIILMCCTTVQWPIKETTQGRNNEKSHLISKQHCNITFVEEKIVLGRLFVPEYIDSTAALNSVY